jgi:hypothetical protein
VTCFLSVAGVRNYSSPHVRDESSGGLVDSEAIVHGGVLDALNFRGADTARPMLEGLLEEISNNTDAATDPDILSHPDENPSCRVLAAYPELGSLLDLLTKPKGSMSLSERRGVEDDVEDAEATVRVRVVTN